MSAPALLRVLRIGFSIEGIAGVEDFARDIVQGAEFLASKIVTLEVDPLSTIPLDLSDSGIGFQPGGFRIVIVGISRFDGF